jgi:hypothetical protein
MLSKHYAVLLAVIGLSFSIGAQAQKADVAFVVGGSFVSDSNVAFTTPCVTPPCTVTTFTNKVQTGNQVILEGALAFRLLNARVASLHLEVPVAGIPSQKLTVNTTPSAVIGHLSSVFVTPGLRLKLVPGAPIVPWASIGAGWANYSGDFGTSNNRGALQYGGGIDFSTGIPALGFRAEVRDFVTGEPNLPSVSIFNIANQSGLRRHNVLAGGGLLLRF